jgi:DNA-binding response OmpR family regulator
MNTNLRPFKTVLIVDDDRVLARIVSSRLREVGVATLMAHDLPEAQHLVGTRAVDAIILDLQMPSGTGDELLQQMREWKRTSATPVLILTGSADVDTAQRLMELGADGFFYKPPDFPALLDRLGQLLLKNSRLEPLAL